MWVNGDAKNKNRFDFRARAKARAWERVIYDCTHY
jgi:hypothetical protein